jgi:hypothetical protein
LFARVSRTNPPPQVGTCNRWRSLQTGTRLAHKVAVPKDDLELSPDHVALIADGSLPQYSQFHCFGIDWPDAVPPVRAR